MDNLFFSPEKFRFFHLYQLRKKELYYKDWYKNSFDLITGSLGVREFSDKLEILRYDSDNLLLTKTNISLKKQEIYENLENPGFKFKEMNTVQLFVSDNGKKMMAIKVKKSNSDEKFFVFYEITKIKNSSEIRAIRVSKNEMKFQGFELMHSLIGSGKYQISMGKKKEDTCYRILRFDLKGNYEVIGVFVYNFIGLILINFHDKGEGKMIFTFLGADAKEVLIKKLGMIK